MIGALLNGISFSFTTERIRICLRRKENGRCIWRRSKSLNFDRTILMSKVYLSLSGSPVEADKDAIKALINMYRRITTLDIGLRLNLSNLI